MAPALAYSQISGDSGQEVAALFENLEDGVSITEFVDLFPGITVQQARLVLEHAAKSTAALVA
jgi:uncharacterized protein (DUF433 family)